MRYFLVLFLLAAAVFMVGCEKSDEVAGVAEPEAAAEKILVKEMWGMNVTRNWVEELTGGYWLYKVGISLEEAHKRISGGYIVIDYPQTNLSYSGYELGPAIACEAAGGRDVTIDHLSLPPWFCGPKESFALGVLPLGDGLKCTGRYFTVEFTTNDPYDFTGHFRWGCGNSMDCATHFLNCNNGFIPFDTKVDGVLTNPPLMKSCDWIIDNWDWSTCP